MAVPEIIEKLVDTFDRNIGEYKSPGYNETELRVEFVNPLWKALGWDMTNEAGCALAYRDVVHEPALRVGSSIKAPDYCFRIGGMRKFFLETKRPSLNLKDDPSPAFQVRRYAFSGKVLSVLTDFEEMAVYDYRARPRKTDKPALGRLRYYTYPDYIEKWGELSSVFSRKAVLEGSFDGWVASTKGKRGTAEVDGEFLEELEGWREALAKNIALRNPRLTAGELSFAVQRTIDRIVFLRICEDRGSEPYGRLKKLLDSGGIYRHLVELFRQTGARYNSGLFYFRQERGRGQPDELTPKLEVDDKILKAILSRLYYPDSPYEFSILPPEILGNVYEQFLGKVIKLTPGHRAKIEEKPEVRKAGGVYYTPRYIVDYIVEKTVGELLKGKTPQRAAKLRILDPACGSGSFLIGAYQHLLDWHRDLYAAGDPAKHARGKDPKLYRAGGDEWRLTTSERRRILLNNIYGVDIDPQAVEVTKLSLLLKVLEGEALPLFHERALPDLAGNIKSGNSLIEPDYYYEGERAGLLGGDNGERRRVNAFDWAAEFPEIFDGKNPGFDAVIGNPPYIFTRDHGFTSAEKAYFYSHFSHQSKQLNSFGIFLEKSRALLRAGGSLGFITPNNWLTIDSFVPLRRLLVNETGDLKIVNILDKVFQDASVDTSLVFFRKIRPTKLTVAEMRGGKETSSCVDTSLLSDSFIIQIDLLMDLESLKVIRKIDQLSVPLASVARVSTGLKAYQKGKGRPPQGLKEKKSRVFHARTKKDRTYWKYLQGRDVCRYSLQWSGEYLSYGDWLAEPRRSVPFMGPRILVRQIPSKPPYMVHGVLTRGKYLNDINSMVIWTPGGEPELGFILGVLNSRLTSYWFQKVYDKLQRKTFPQFKVKELGRFPAPPTAPADKGDAKKRTRLVELVGAMLDLHKSIQGERIPAPRLRLERDISATDHQIDTLVYELYGLTDEEIRIVEGDRRTEGSGSP